MAQKTQMKLGLSISLALIIAAGFSQPLASLSKQAQFAIVNWTAGIARAKGVGYISDAETNRAKAYADAKNYALVDARVNLIALVDQIQVDAKFTSEQLTLKNPEVRTKLLAALRTALIIGEREIVLKGHPAVEVEVSVPLYGAKGLMALIFPSGSLSTIVRAANEPRIDLRDPDVPAPERIEIQGNYTGLVVDASGLKISPSMLPKVMTPDKAVIYGSGNIDPDRVIEYGMAVYTVTLEDGIKHSRSGANPLVVKAIGAQRRDAASTEVIISSADAAMILAEEAKTGFLKKLNVVIVTEEARKNPQ